MALAVGLSDDREAHLHLPVLLPESVVTEAELQAAVLDLAKLRGWLRYHTYDSRRSEPGWPDLFLLHPRTGQIVVAELKAANGRVSRAQRQWIDGFAVAGITVHVWRPEHLRGGQIAAALTPSDMRQGAA